MQRASFILTDSGGVQEEAPRSENPFSSCARRRSGPRVSRPARRAWSARTPTRSSQMRRPARGRGSVPDHEHDPQPVRRRHGGSKDRKGPGGMMGQFETISVIGLGYIGLPTAAALATRGVRGRSGSTSTRTPSSDQQRQDPFHRARSRHHRCMRAVTPACCAPRRAGAGGRLHHRRADAGDRDDNAPDLSYVEAARVRRSPRCLQPGNLVILESTSPVGTRRAGAAAQLGELRPDLHLP